MSDKRFTKSRLMDGYHLSIVYKVVGFWSHSPVSIWQDMDFKDGEWTWKQPRISRSIGGQDGTIGEFESEENFVAALKDAIRHARRLDKRTGKPAKPKMVAQRR